MKDEQLLQRVVCDPGVMTGKPVIRGARLTVDFILNLLAHGTTEEEIRAEYPGISREDVHACLLFATRTLKDTDFMPLAGWAGVCGSLWMNAQGR
jgi:uncharacterized protein (DUF433 family)